LDQGPGRPGRVSAVRLHRRPGAGQAGLLDGLSATTHHTTFDLLRQLAPSTTVYEDRRYVDNGRVITSAGVSAGIDMALYVVQKLLGEAGLQPTLAEMEYRWQPEVEAGLKGLWTQSKIKQGVYQL